MKTGCARVGSMTGVPIGWASRSPPSSCDDSIPLTPKWLDRPPNQTSPQTLQMDRLCQVHPAATFFCVGVGVGVFLNGTHLSGN